MVLNSGTSVAELLYCHRRTGYLGLYQIAQKSRMKDVLGRGLESFLSLSLISIASSRLELVFYTCNRINYMCIYYMMYVYSVIILKLYIALFI